MENKYELYIHNISTLILDNKPQRAIPILHKLIHKGIRTTEIYILLAYATKMMEGQIAALEILKKCPCESPIIYMAISQFSMEIKAYRECSQNMHKMLVEVSKTEKLVSEIEVPCFKADKQKTEKNQGIMNTVAEKMKIFESPGQKPPEYEEINFQINTTAINMANYITQSLQKGIISKREAKQKYEQILAKQQLEGKLKQNIKKFVLYLSYSN